MESIVAHRRQVRSKEAPSNRVHRWELKNHKRLYFIPKSDFEKILAKVSDTEGKLILALARYGGLRCPTEVLGLKWQDVDWSQARVVIHSVETEGHESGGSRTIPIFAELHSYLRDAFEQARPGATCCVERHRLASIDLRTQIRRFIRRAGLEPWPRTLQNLRASRAAELSEIYPIRTDTAWLGHSLTTATKHYLSVPPEHFSWAAHFPAQHPAAQAA